MILIKYNTKIMKCKDICLSTHIEKYQSTVKKRDSIYFPSLK